MERKNDPTTRHRGATKVAATLIVSAVILGGVILTAQAGGGAALTAPPAGPAGSSGQVQEETVIEVVRLKYAEAEYVAQILTRLLSASMRKGEQFVIVPDSVRNSLLVRAWAERLAEIRELIKETDYPVDSEKAPAGAERDLAEVRIFRLKHAEAEYVAKILSQLLSGLMRKGEQFVIVPDAMRNSLLVRASQERLAEIGELIEETDYPVDRENAPAGIERDLAEVRVFRLEYAEAEDVASLLEALLRQSTAGLPPAPINIVPDVTRNNLLIRTHEGCLEMVEALIAELDQPARSKARGSNADATSATGESGEQVKKTGLGDAEVQIEEARRLESAQRLKKLGLALVMYANEHGGKYPQMLGQVEPYCQFTSETTGKFPAMPFGQVTQKEVYSWPQQFVRYVGGGRTLKDGPETALAFDQDLLERAGGTNVLFVDSHVRFVKREELKEVGIGSTAVSIDVRFLSVSDEFLEALGLDANAAGEIKALAGVAHDVKSGPGKQEPQHVLLDKMSVRQLLRATQKDKEAKVLTSPRVTVLDGEQVEMYVMGETRVLKRYLQLEWPGGGRPIRQR